MPKKKKTNQVHVQSKSLLGNEARLLVINEDLVALAVVTRFKKPGG